MIPNPSIDELAERISERNGPDADSPWDGPYILFLGEGCAHAAGAPPRAAIARQALRTFGLDRGLAPDDQASDESVFARFAAYTEKLSPDQLARMLRSLYANVAVPSFYQDLALLVRERYFPLILTMNFDTLLEQALASSGVRNSEYRITTFGPYRRISSGPDPGAAQPPLTHIVKLHGDLAQGAAHVAPEQIEEALGASRQRIRSNLKGDLVMVAHVIGDDPIDHWLSHSPSRELWWVNAEPAADPARVASWADGNVREITGETGRPQVFFTQLALRLLRAPDAAGASPEPESRAEADPLADTLGNEILRNQSVLYSLEQQANACERSPQVQAQITYQKRQITHLEDRIRSLPDIRPRLVDCVRRIGESIRGNARSVVADPGTVEKWVQFVEAQAATLLAEFNQQEAPNQILVSASLGATLALADRLLTEYGPGVVDPEDVKQLASLVPTAAGKVVL